jgi:hypothetical protein
MASFNVPTLEVHLNEIRLLPPGEISCLSELLPLEHLPLDHLNQLSNNDRTTAYRACLLAWAVTGGTQVSQELQLCSCLATHNRHDSLISAGTGSGKTLPIALNLLLDDPADGFISLTISPLKCLQITQVSQTLLHMDTSTFTFWQGNDFNIKYGIPTVAINDDTLREDVYWNASHVSSLISAFVRLFFRNIFMI